MVELSDFEVETTGSVEYICQRIDASWSCDAARFTGELSMWRIDCILSCSKSERNRSGRALIAVSDGMANVYFFGVLCFARRSGFREQIV